MSECDKAKIVGYKEQSPEQIEAINCFKEMEIQAVEMINVFFLPDNDLAFDKRWMSIAKTHLQQAFMAVVRAVARPEGD